VPRDGSPSFGEPDLLSRGITRESSVLPLARDELFERILLLSTYFEIRATSTLAPAQLIAGLVMTILSFTVMSFLKAKITTHLQSTDKGPSQ